MKKELGLTHIYCGDGKGKTSAAVGLAVRAAGAGLKIVFAQFLKTGTSSEIKTLEKIENISVKICYAAKKFTFEMTEDEKAQCKDAQTSALRRLFADADEEGTDLLVLDEALGAVCTGTLCEDELIGLLENKPSGLEVVLTGRNPSPELLELADYVTEMKKIKHPFDKGIPAREGIEK